jgi:protein ImuB
VRGARRVGLTATVGVAATRGAARIAARLAQRSASAGCHVVPPGTDADALAAVPLDVLDLPRELRDTLGRWGVRTLGDLAALPRAGLAMRLGRAGLDAQDHARGRDAAPFQPWTPPPFWQEAQGLEWEIDTWSALAPVLARLLGRLTARLGAAHVAADSVRLDLGLANGTHEQRTVGFASPLTDVNPMLALLALELEAHPPSGPISRVAVHAHAVRTEAAQARLGQRPGPALRDVADTVARLATLVGRDNVGSPRVLDSHRPDAVAMVALSPTLGDDTVPGGHDERDDDRASPGPDIGERGPRAAAPPGAAMAAPPGACLHAALAFRRVRPPRRVDVEVADGRPVSVRFHDALGGVSAAQRVVASAGPWRTSGEWWTSEGWAREEWDLALADGMLCRVVRDRVAGDWSLDGAYD